MKAMNCKRCREEFVNKQYNFFTESAHTMCCFSTAAVLAVMMKRGRSKEYIKKLYEDIKLMYDLPQIDGKQITMTEVMHQLETEYDIDFNEIKLNLETRKEFKHDIQG